MYCDCENQPAALVDIPIVNCPEEIGQIHKLLLQRIYSTGTTKNSFVIATADPTALASWTPLLDAVAGTKVVQTPVLSAPVIVPGGPINFGGGNDTPDGVEINLGSEQSSFDARFLQVHQSSVLAMKMLHCEYMGAYLVGANGKIWAVSNAAGTIYYPIPLQSWYLSDKGVPGKVEPSYNLIGFKLPPGWSDYLVSISPADFNARTDMVAS